MMQKNETERKGKKIHRIVVFAYEVKSIWKYLILLLSSIKINNLKFNRLPWILDRSNQVDSMANSLKCSNFAAVVSFCYRGFCTPTVCKCNLRAGVRVHATLNAENYYNI